MGNCMLMPPLFFDGSFNRAGRKMRAVFEREVSNGKETYRIWRRAGKPNLEYPRADNDKYILHVEINGYLVHMGLTEFDLIDNCGFQAAAKELYGGKKNRRNYFDTLRKSGDEDAVRAAIAKEHVEVVRLGGDPVRQANYIRKMFMEHIRFYLEAKENGGATFPDFVGALLENDLIRCMELSAIYKEKCRREMADRAAHAAEEDQAYCQKRNSEAEQAVSKAVQILQKGGVLENETITFYQGRYHSSSYSIVNHLMRMYQINVPLRTQGWINERLISATIKNGRCGQQRFLRSKRGQGSQKFFQCMNDLIHAATARGQSEVSHA